MEGVGLPQRKRTQEGTGRSSEQVQRRKFLQSSVSPTVVCGGSSAAPDRTPLSGRVRGSGMSPRFCGFGKISGDVKNVNSLITL